MSWIPSLPRWASSTSWVWGELQLVEDFSMKLQQLLHPLGQSNTETIDDRAVFWTAQKWKLVVIIIHLMFAVMQLAVRC